MTMETHQDGLLLLALILFTLVSFGTLGGVIVYQGIAQLIGFNTAEAVVTSCSSFINYKLTIASTLYKIAFIGGGFSCVCLICALIVLIVQKCGINKKPSEQLLNQQLQPNNNSQAPIMFQNKLILIYIIYSLAILGNIMHFGLMLNIFVCQMQCQMTVNIPQIVIFGLSFVCLLFLMMSWISIQVLRYKINLSLQQIQQQSPHTQHNILNQTQLGYQVIVSPNKDGIKKANIDEENEVHEENKNIHEKVNNQQKQNNRSDERYYVTNNLNSSHPLNTTIQLNEPLLLKNVQIEMVPIQIHPTNTNNVNNAKNLKNGYTNIKQNNTLPTNVANVDKANLNKVNVNKVNNVNKVDVDVDVDVHKVNADKVNVDVHKVNPDKVNDKPMAKQKNQQIIKPVKQNQIMVQNKVKATQNNVNMLNDKPTISNNNIKNPFPQAITSNKLQNNEKLIPKNNNANISTTDDQNIGKNKTSTHLPLNNGQINNKVVNNKVTGEATTKINHQQQQQQQHIQPVQTKQNPNMSSSNPMMNYSTPVTNSNPENGRLSNNILDQPPQPIEFILSQPNKIQGIKTNFNNSNAPTSQLTYSVAPNGEKQNIAFIPILMEPSTKKLQILTQNNEAKDHTIIKNTKQINSPLIDKEIKMQNNNSLIRIQQSNISQKKKKKKRSPKSRSNSKNKSSESQLKNKLLLEQQVQLQQQQQQLQMQIQQQQQMLIMQLQQQLHQSQMKSQIQNHPNTYAYAHQQEYYPKYEGRKKSLSPPPIPKKSPIKYTQQIDQSSIQFDNHSQYKIIQSPYHKKSRQLQYNQWPQTSKGNMQNRYEKQIYGQNEQNQKILSHSIAMSKISRQNQSRQDENYVNKQIRRKDQLSNNKYFKSVSFIQQKSKEYNKNLLTSQGFQSNQSSNKKKTDSDQNFQEEGRKFYESVSSRTQRSYVQQRDHRDKSQLNLHKDLKKEIQHKKQDTSTQRVYNSKLIKSNKPKKKVSLIDYIRSKYAD